MTRALALTGGMLFSLIAAAQQDPSMYLLYKVPESNLLNPAVPLTCPWYIGLPVLSSVHVNYGNSLTTYNQLFRRQTDADRRIAVEETVARMHRRDFFGTEVHVQFLALGHKWGDNSVIFTLTEKDNLPVTLPAEGVDLIWNGNTSYENRRAGLEGTGAFLSHYREYALAWSRHTSSGIYFGVRGKLLFGKLNLSTSRNHLNVMTDDRTFDLSFQGDFRIDASLPLIVTTNPDGTLNNITLDEDVSPMDLLFNGRNPGFAVDAGVIVPYGDRWTFSLSLLDLGMIRWRSYLNNMQGKGSYAYRGLDALPQSGDGYFDELVNEVVDAMNMEYVQEAYTTWLPSRLMAAAAYQVNEKLRVGLTGEALFLKTKMVTDFTFSGQYNPLPAFSLMLSYTLQYNSFNNLGAGLVFGRDPVQFYILSTNIPGMVKPLDTRSVNLRFGFNILLGCRQKQDESGSKGSGSTVVKARAANAGTTPVHFRPTNHCYSGMPQKEKAYKKNIKKRRRSRKVKRSKG
jgi:hypothetical protein